MVGSLLFTSIPFVAASDLLLFHVILSIKGLTTYEYILANRGHVMASAIGHLPVLCCCPSRSNRVGINPFRAAQTSRGQGAAALKQEQQKQRQSMQGHSVARPSHRQASAPGAESPPRSESGDSHTRRSASHGPPLSELSEAQTVPTAERRPEAAPAGLGSGAATADGATPPASWFQRWCRCGIEGPEDDYTMVHLPLPFSDNGGGAFTQSQHLDVRASFWLDTGVSLGVDGRPVPV